MTGSVRVVLVQMVSSRDLEPNLERAESLIAEAAVSEPDAIFLPENFVALASDRTAEIAAAETGRTGPVLPFLAAMAQRAGCWLFAGTLPLAHRPDGSAVTGGRVRAASLVFSPDGSLAARYDKVHMFDVDVNDNHGAYRESASFEPGESPECVECPFGIAGLSVCYDLRFPEFYRLLFEAGADLVAVPSAFTELTGSAHFEVLMRARAVENSCFMIAACQGGVHDSGRRTHGHSMVVGPWGDVLGELGRGEGVLDVRLDLGEQRRIREQMPFRQQRRF